MTVPTLSRAERKRVDRELYADIRRRFDAELPKHKKRYTGTEVENLSTFLTDRTTAVMLGIVHEAMEATPGVTPAHTEALMALLKVDRAEPKETSGPMLRKAVIDRLATVQKTIMLDTVERAVAILPTVRGIGPRRQEAVMHHIARLLRENS